MTRVTVACEVRRGRQHTNSSWAQLVAYLCPLQYSIFRRSIHFKIFLSFNITTWYYDFISSSWFSCYSVFKNDFIDSFSWRCPFSLLRFSLAIISTLVFLVLDIAFHTDYFFFQHHSFTFCSLMFVCLVIIIILSWLTFIILFLFCTSIVIPPKVLVTFVFYLLCKSFVSSCMHHIVYILV